MSTHLIIVPCEDPSHGIRCLYATVDGAGSLSPSYIDTDGVAYKVPADHVFPIRDAGLGYHRNGIAGGIEAMIREALPDVVKDGIRAKPGGVW